MADALSRDPYKNFRFKIYFGEATTDNLVAGVSNVSGLSWSAEVVTYPEGGDHQSDRKAPGGISYEPVSLSRGITTNRRFKEWAEAVWNYNKVNPLEGFRKTVVCDLCDENGNPVVRYTLSRCWVSEYATLPELSAEDNAVAIETIRVEHEGWSHDVLGGIGAGGRDATL